MPLHRVNPKPCTKCTDCIAAALNGHLDCLENAYTSGNGEHWRDVHANDNHWKGDTCLFAALNGHLDCLRYAHEHGAPLDEYTCVFAAKNGHLDCLRYAHENGAPWDEETCFWAACNCHFECLIYAYANGAPWGNYTCSAIACQGHLKYLRYAHENGAPLDSLICLHAAKNGHTDCLRYAFLVGAPWPKAPQEMIAWRDRVRDTAGKILKTHHAIRVRSANTIKRAWLEYFYRPGNRGSELAKVHFEECMCGVASH